MKTIDPNSYKMLRILIWHCAYRMMKPVAWVFSVMITLSLWTFFAHMPDGYIGLWIAIVLISIWAFGIWKNWHSTARIYLLQQHMDIRTLWNYRIEHNAIGHMTMSRKSEHDEFFITIHNLSEYRQGVKEYYAGAVMPHDKFISYHLGWFMKSRSRWA